MRNAPDEENDPSEHFDKSNSNLEESSESGSVNVENSPIRQLGVKPIFIFYLKSNSYFQQKIASGSGSTENVGGQTSESSKISELTSTISTLLSPTPEWIGYLQAGSIVYMACYLINGVKLKTNV